MSRTTDWFLALEEIKQADLRDYESGDLQRRYKVQLLLILTYLQERKYSEAKKYIKELLV